MQVAKKSITYKIALKYLFCWKVIAQSGHFFGVSGEALTQSRSDSGVYTGLLLWQALPAVIFARFHALNVQQLHHGFAVRSPLKRLRNRDRMCKCNTVTRDDIPFAIWSGLRPDTPHQCVRAQCGFRFSSASSPTRSLTFGRWAGR